MKLSTITVMVAAMLLAAAIPAGAATINWDGVTWGLDSNTGAVNNGNLVLTGDTATQYHGYNGYGALVGVYPYGGNGTGQTHATWDPGTFNTQWFQFTYIDGGVGVSAMPYIMIEQQDLPGYRGFWLSSEGVDASVVGYVGKPDLNWGDPSTYYEGTLFSRVAGTHTIAVLLHASDSSIDLYYDGNLAATATGTAFNYLEHIYLGSLGASGETLTYTDFQLGTNSMPPSAPEPATLSLLGLGAIGLIRRRRNA